MGTERARLLVSLGDDLEELLVGSAETSARHRSPAPPLAQLCLPGSLTGMSAERAPQQTLIFTIVSGEPRPAPVAWPTGDSLSFNKYFGSLWLCDQPPQNPVAKNNGFVFVCFLRFLCFVKQP